jgi:ACS family hexuronate transporter-like MFS transporter
MPRSSPHATDDRAAWPWLVCGVLLVATLLNYMDRQILAVTLPALKTEFHLTESRVGMVEGCFGFAFAFGALLFGWLADHWGPRWLYPLVLTGWSCAGIATGFAGHPAVTDWLQGGSDPEGTGIYRWLLICRTVLGVFEAGHWPCALLTVRAVLSSRNRTLGNGILQSGASIGAVLVPIYVEAVERSGRSWPFAFWSVGIVGLAWVPLWFTLLRGRTLHPATLATGGGPSASAAGSAADTSPATGAGFWRRFAALAVVIATLTISWQFLRAWLALFLQDHLGYSREATRGLMSGYFISADVGCLLSGALVTFLARKGWQVHSARLLGYALFCGLTACGALVPWVGQGPWMIVCLLVAGAGILGLHPYYYSLTQELSTQRMGLFSGILGAFGWIVSSVTQIVLGRQIEATHSYALGLQLVGLAPLLGLLALALLWPRSPRGSAPARPA